MAENTEDRPLDEPTGPTSDEAPETPPEAASATPPEMPPTGRGRHFLRWLAALVIVAILAIAGAVGVAAYRDWATPEPEEILRRMVATQQDADSYGAEGELVMETRMAGMEYTMTYPFKVVYQKPNLMYAEYGEGMAAFKTVCDGTHLYLEMTSFNRVAKVPAPEDLQDMNWCQSCMTGFQGEGMEKWTELYEQLQGNADLGNVNVKAGIDESNEWLASLEAPGNTWAVTVEIMKGLEMTLWVDRRTSLMRQTAVEIGWDQIMEMASEEMPLPWDDAGAKDDFGAAMMGMFEDMRLRMAMTCEEASVGREAPKETFTYTPPEGVEVTEVDKLEEMHQGLMQAFMPERMPEWRGPGADRWPSKPDEAWHR